MGDSIENGFWLAIGVNPSSHKRTPPLTVWGNDAAGHLVENQTVAEKGATVPDLGFSLIGELAIGCVLPAQEQTCYGTK